MERVTKLLLTSWELAGRHHCALREVIWDAKLISAVLASGALEAIL